MNLTSSLTYIQDFIYKKSLIISLIYISGVLERARCSQGCQSLYPNAFAYSFCALLNTQKYWLFIECILFFIECICWFSSNPSLDPLLNLPITMVLRTVSKKKVYCARVFISFNKMHAVDSFLLISFCRKMSQTVDNFMRMKLMADPYSSVVFFGISYSLQESYASQIEVVHQCYELCCFLLQTSTRLNFATMKLHP